MRRLGLDRWDVIGLAGVGLLTGGVSARWGASWACILLGVLLLGVAVLHEWRAGRAGKARE